MIVLFRNFSAVIFENSHFNIHLVVSNPRRGHVACHDSLCSQLLGLVTFFLTEFFCCSCIVLMWYWACRIRCCACLVWVQSPHNFIVVYPLEASSLGIIREPRETRLERFAGSCRIFVVALPSCWRRVSQHGHRHEGQRGHAEVESLLRFLPPSLGICSSPSMLLDC